MAMDRVRPLKIESVSEGGSSNDESMTEMNIGQDYYDGQGIALQVSGATSSTADSTTYVSRPAATQLAFTDQASGTLTLEQLVTSVAGKPGSHNALADILHWLGAPGDGFASGAYRQTILTGLLPSTVTWWSSSAMTTRLFSTAFTYSGVICTQKVHTLYASGTLVRTLTETFSYSQSLFAPAVTRTWT